MKSLLAVFLFLHYITVSRSDRFQVVGPDGPLVAEAGEDLILPCSLKPNISAVDMRVEWFRLHTSDSLVHLYKDGVDRNEDQIQSYRGRTSLFKEELQKGNASLKLSRVKVSDEGQYKCLIRSEGWFDDITVEVSVEVVGTQPVISMEGYSIGKGVSLLCESNDWWPEPDVLWLDNDGNPLPAEDTETLSDPERFHVKKRVTVQDSNSNRFYCRVMLRDHMKETEIVISKSIFRTWVTAVVCISVAVLVTVIGLIGLFLSIRRMKGFDKEKQNAVQNVSEKIRAECAEEKEKQIREEFNRRWRKHAKDVTLDPDTAHPLLMLSADGKEVTYEDVPQELSENKERFVDSKSVLGKEGFSSGRFYYEVQVSGKTAWSLGVVSESIDRAKHIERKPENGFWVVSLLYGTYMARADPNVSLSVKKNPQTVGVFVDYEEGVVSFYDAEARSLIYSFTGQTFTEKLYPYFAPYHHEGGKNSAPLIITPVSHTE